LIPIRLQLTNFLSYHEPVDVDFTQLHLACISGQNGAGKSSLLDAMTWALFGEARSTNDALIFSSADTAEVTLDFEYEELVYRIVRRKQRSKTGTLDLFLKSILEDGMVQWKPLNEKSISKTQESIVRILRMDFDTFTNASFFLQGRADQFAQKNPTERKKILGSILGLDIWDAYNKKAAEKRKKLETDRTMIDLRVAEIDEELNEESTRKARFEELNLSLTQFSQQKKSLENSLNSLRLLDGMLKEQKKQLDNFKSQLTVKRKAFDSTVSLLELRKSEQTEMNQLLSRSKEITENYKKWRGLRTSLEGLEVLAGKFHNLREEKTAPFLAIEKARSSLEQELKYLLETKASVEGLLKEIPARKNDFERELKLIAELGEQICRKPEFEQQKEELRLEKEEISAENKRLSAEMNLLSARRDNMQSTHEPTCPFCGQDLSPDQRATLLEEIEADGKKLGDEYRENQNRINGIDTRLKALDGELQTIARLETEKHSLERKTDVTRAWLGDREPEVEKWENTGKVRLPLVEQTLQSESYAQDERFSLLRIEKDILALKYDAAVHEGLRKQEQILRNIDAEYQKLENTRSAIAPLERQIQDLEVQRNSTKEELDALEKSTLDAENDLANKTAGMPNLAEAELEFRRAIEQENALRDDTAAARQKVEVLASLRIKRKEFQEERESISKRIDQYKQLERAFGKDGVPALLIEQALPEIENEANDLLDRLTAGEMSVRFVTQRDYKDKNREDKKETLDIQISDATGVRDYEMFSGGEAFRVNFAIRLALSRVLAQRAGARLQTLVIDEGFGSQDAIGRQRLVEAINLVQTDFAKILVITHLEELKDAFPSRIEVEKTNTGSVVSVVV
jgi:exonuclease SbcC